MSQPDLAKSLKNVSAKDRKQIEQAQEMLGPDPSTMGFIKNLFWGRIREELIFPMPVESDEERTRCDELLAKLDVYLETEHPTVEIDQTQSIPDWVITRLFDLGVMGMIAPQQYGGGGFGITSYNRVLARLGETCGSTAVVVSAHQSIGCGAIMLFGTEAQKTTFLPRICKDTLSAFCLSEPNVGCDAGGQETRIEKDENGDFIIRSGRKKWATSGALSGIFTVMGKQKIVDPKTGKAKDKVTALICTPDMEGIKITSCNRSKSCIRGTWQARMEFKDVKVPKAHLLHHEGRGLNVALTCLNYGRCTLSAGMVGAARTALAQSAKWAQYRHQFDRPIGEFDLVQDNIAKQRAWVYAMESMLTYTTGMVDRGDEDIMLETAICKVFCSHFGFEGPDAAMQVMGGEGFMTENELERVWRDSRINTVVEGANEVMHSFVFAYGAKQFSERLLAMKEKPWAFPISGLRLATELFGGIRRGKPRMRLVKPELRDIAGRAEARVQELSHQLVQMSWEHKEGMVSNQMVQRRFSWAAIWLHAVFCTLSRLQQTMDTSKDSQRIKEETTVARYFCSLAFEAIDAEFAGMYRNSDDAMRACAKVALEESSRRPQANYAMPESTPDPDAFGKGRPLKQDGITQFGEGSQYTGEPVQKLTSDA